MPKLTGLSQPLALLGQGLLASAREEEAGRQRDATARAVAQLEGDYARQIAQIRADADVAQARERTQQAQLATPFYQHTGNGALSPRQALALEAGLSGDQIDVVLAGIDGKLPDLAPADKKRVADATVAIQRAMRQLARTGSDLLAANQAEQQGQRNGVVEALIRRGASAGRLGEYAAAIDGKPLYSANGVGSFSGGLAAGGRELANIEGNARVAAAGAGARASRRPLEEELLLLDARAAAERGMKDEAPPYQAGLVKDLTGAQRFDPAAYARAVEVWNAARGRTRRPQPELYSVFGEDTPAGK